MAERSEAKITKRSFASKIKILFFFWLRFVRPFLAKFIVQLIGNIPKWVNNLRNISVTILFKTSVSAFAESVVHNFEQNHRIGAKIGAALRRHHHNEPNNQLDSKNSLAEITKLPKNFTIFQFRYFTKIFKISQKNNLQNFIKKLKILISGMAISI